MTFSGEKLRISQSFDRIADKMKVGDTFYNEVLGIETDYFGDILDIGCGHGVILKALESKIGVKSLVGLDISPKVIEIAQGNVAAAKFVVASADALPFSGNAFDFVFMIDVLQYLPDYEAALREARRVLRPNGTLICNFANKDWLLFDDQYFRIRKKIDLPIQEQFFTFSEMVRVLQGARFNIKRYRGADCFRYYAPYHKYEQWLAVLVPWMHRKMKKVVFEATVAQ